MGKGQIQIHEEVKLEFATNFQSFQLRELGCNADFKVELECVIVAAEGGQRTVISQTSAL